MDMRWIEPEVCRQMSVPETRNFSPRRNVYRLRVAARVFGLVGFATVVYAAALVAIAMEAAMIEF